MLYNRYQTRNIKPLPVDNYKTRVYNQHQTSSLAYVWHIRLSGISVYPCIWGVLLLGVMGTSLLTRQNRVCLIYEPYSSNQDIATTVVC
jgi:hypothetical protein